jgi:ubiquitin-protein ligase
MKAVISVTTPGGDWSPTLDLAVVLRGIVEVIKDPKKVGEPLSPEKGIELLEHPAQFARNARAFTRQHARG